MYRNIDKIELKVNGRSLTAANAHLGLLRLAGAPAIKQRSNVPPLVDFEPGFC